MIVNLSITKSHRGIVFGIPAEPVGKWWVMTIATKFSGENETPWLQSYTDGRFTCDIPFNVSAFGLVATVTWKSTKSLMISQMLTERLHFHLSCSDMIPGICNGNSWKLMQNYPDMAFLLNLQAGQQHWPEKQPRGQDHSQRNVGTHHSGGGIFPMSICQLLVLKCPNQTFMGERREDTTNMLKNVRQ